MTASAETAALLPVGGVFHGVLDSPADSDWIKAELTAGASYLLVLTARDHDGPLSGAGDTVLEIYNGQRELVARVDDQPFVDGVLPDGGLHPSHSFSPDAGGVYYFRVSSYFFPGRDYSGGYQLDLVETGGPDFLPGNQTPVVVIEPEPEPNLTRNPNLIRNPNLNLILNPNLNRSAIL